jgi:hypothetical protein
VKVRRSMYLLTGAAGMYFLDPISGHRRRVAAREKLRARAAARSPGGQRPRHSEARNGDTAAAARPSLGERSYAS